MDKSNFLTQFKPKSYLRFALTLFLILFAGKFIIKDALPYFGFEKETFGHYWIIKWSLIGHISGGILALIIGPFQFSKAFRNKFMTTHRWLGRIYLTAILIATISATYIAWTTAIQVNFSWAFSLQMLAFAWIVTASMAYLSVMKGRIIQHKEWMIRSYVVTFAFVNFRWLNELTIVKNLMPEFEERGATIIWLSWTIPLLITEIVLSWKKK
ncbi:MAG: DUF2306 domain-containing protein [Sphingobacteriia bacterium]|nr:MAG: DUF2306 domain-containing protein [Sphingobacteriia bacterium]